MAIAVPVIVNVPVRAAPVVFAATVKLTTPLPAPEAPAVTVRNAALLTAVHAHPVFAVTAMDADFYAISAHKLFGPTGVGALYGKKALLDAMPPWQGGGAMIKDVTFEHTIYNEVPEKFDLQTGAIKCRIKKVYRGQIRFQGSEIRRG